ncbi:maestro heat-like repeat-containing protein family member 7 isoform X2 [Vombatus ursinus]|uniref:maestro heat-like repeat-containing protein family member 7 isoform X2 n=1 Tax=Vombatus ursinus TaxID=29139 RepID=UPI000FFD9689|nr:maestro heat-like repeat-containing protein family member 7 isoform X2 [Vombatus ursinus]
MVHTGFLPTENEAFDFILGFLKSKKQDESTKMTFLSSVSILCSAVQSQKHRNMDYYCSKAMLAERVEVRTPLGERGGEVLSLLKVSHQRFGSSGSHSWARCGSVGSGTSLGGEFWAVCSSRTFQMLMLEEPADMMSSSLRQQAMFCIMEMSQVNPKFQPLQRMELIQSGILSLISLPHNMEADTNREIISLYSRTVRALDEMLQGLMTETENPSMLVFIEIMEMLMPWILSNKIFEEVRALRTLSQQLRFISSFPVLRHLENFKIGGNLMGILGLVCMDSNYEVSTWASVALHYCFKFFVNQRQSVLKNEEERRRLLKNLQKNFQADWTTSLQYIVMFFKIFLNPDERTTIFTLCVNAMTAGSRYNTWAAVQMLEMIIDEPLPELSKVPELIETIHSNLNYIKDSSAIQIIEKTLQELAHKYPDEVILMLITIQDNVQNRELWKILAASSSGYATILSHLLKRLSFQDPKEPTQSLEISSVLASRALNELLLQSSSKLEVETLYPWLYMALLSLISFLVFEGGSKTFDKQPGLPEGMSPVSCVIESLKTLISSAGYEYQVSFMQNYRTWELLTEPEGYLEGISILAKSMTMRSCWHIRPIVSLILNILSGNEVGSFVTALAVFAELLRSTEVAIMADEAIIEILINLVQEDKPVIQQLVLKAAGNLGIHKETTKFLRMLQPYVLNCCYSMNSSVVAEAFLSLRYIIYNLTWTDSVVLLVEISCTLRPFFDDESEELRYNSIDMFSALLAKVKRRFLMVPFRYQVHCSLVPLMFHLQDENTSVAHVSRDGLCHSAKILVCPRLKSVCSTKDMYSIGSILLEEQKDKIPWFLSQSLSYFHNTQSSIRQAAVWLTTNKSPAGLSSLLIARKARLSRSRPWKMRRNFRKSIQP